ncbi:hypothetical protein MBLNU459_g7010t1 [Dothideomycetes sp. NU459]
MMPKEMTIKSSSEPSTGTNEMENFQPANSYIRLDRVVMISFQNASTEELRKTLTVHESLLRNSSPLLATHIVTPESKQEFSKLKLGSNSLSFRSWEIYLLWLYHRRISIPAANFTDQYRFALTVNDVDFIDALTDALLLYLKDASGDRQRTIRFRSMVVKFEETRLWSPVSLKLVSDLAMHIDRDMVTLDPSVYCNNLDLHRAVLDYARQLLDDLVRGNQPRITNPFLEDSCNYHEHRLIDRPCYKTKHGGLPLSIIPTLDD